MTSRPGAVWDRLAFRPAVHPVVRYGELEPPDRTLLLAMEAQGGASDGVGLARVLAVPAVDLHPRLRALAALGLIQEAAGRWAMVPELRDRVQRDLGASVGARVVLRCDQTVRCPEPNVGERVLRSLCREVFAPHVVRPWVPLRQVLDVQVMNTLLDEPDRAFLANRSVQVDVLVEDLETGRALLAVELDGPQHERSPQLERDARKDRILRVSGLPLLRLWTCEADPPGEELLRALLGWRLRGALRDPRFLAACPAALREVLERCLAPAGEEFHTLSSVLGEELLTSLLGEGPGAPAREATLTEIVAGLRATHSDEGIRQWFERARYTLRGECPRDILRGEWSPGDARVRRVCRLAAAGGSFFAT
ncbi:DUF2726 domain-containing protein [Deinococcus sp. NW-56]|uniref:DUF2726 domain-containing protein n=1 Tax=Deinococcus sp. NW-56 TaxID=2080419 RepID=UPI000CF434C1|nr:DUF2726 domain-containing protein [Deinococcus sp. NW-56]